MKSILIILLLLPTMNSFSQKQYVEEHEFIGSKESEYVFFQFGSRRGIPKPHLIYYKLQDSKFIFEKSVPWTDKSKGVPIHVNDNFKLNDLGASKIRIKIGNKDTIFNFSPQIDFFGNKFLASAPDSDTVFISSHTEAPIYLFNKETFEFTPLPLTGSNLYIRGDYLFFEAPRYSDNYSSFPKDVYRAKLNDLKNPEKVLIQVNKWYPYTENVLYASTDPFLRLDGVQTYGFYNLKDQTVAKSPGIATQDIIEIKGEPYLLEIEEKSGEKVFKLEELPKLPKSFPYKISETDNQNPKGEIFQYYNIPLKEKKMIGTVLTQYLMYDAPAEKLKELTKDQLRFLRNAFYALHGYKFKSEELTKYFNQFDWYQKMTKGEKSNEGIVIWPDEKERVMLIREIESEK